MKHLIRQLVVIFAVLAPAIAQAQGMGPPPGQFDQRMRGSPDQREQLRDERHRLHEERRQRRESWQQMSPEERHQLRRDIRDAGETLYPRRMQRRD